MKDHSRLSFHKRIQYDTYNRHGAIAKMKIAANGGSIELLNDPLEKLLSVLGDKNLAHLLVCRGKRCADLVKLCENLLLGRILREVCIELLHNKSAQGALRGSNRGDGLNGSLRNAKSRLVKLNKNVTYGKKGGQKTEEENGTYS